MSSSPSRGLRYTLVALRAIVGGLFVYGGYVKLMAPWALFAMSIDNYHIVPFRWVEPMARTLPWAEVALGVWFISGLLLRLSGLVSSALMATFFTAMVHAKIAGQQIDCGCFGPGEPISKWTLLRDGSLLAASLAVTWFAYRGARKKRDA